MPARKALLSCLVVSLLGVLAPLANAQTTTLNFDSGAGSDTSSSPGYVNASVYFATYGINMSSITPGTQVVIINNNALYGGTATVPPSPPNLLTQFGLNTAISFTLNFPSPLTNISFTRAGLIAGPSGVTHPRWSAHAINSQGVEVASAGEALIASFTDVPAQTFTLTGIDITFLRFDSNGLNFAGFSGVLLDDLVIAPFSPPAAVTSCVPDTWTACVLNNRFQARLRVRNHFANPQYDFDASVKPVSGFASAQSETAFFHFGDANNIELLVKLLNAGNSGIAVLYGVATPFELWMTITDTRSGAFQTYHTARDAMNGQTQFGAFPIDVPSPTNFTFTALTDLDSKTVGEFYSYSFCQPPITGNALCSSPPATNPTGGSSPYHFQLGSGVGFPPSGVQLALNGILSGTASVQGDSTFQVCAVDLVGTSKCSTVHQHIRPASTPPPGSNFYANWDCQNQSQCIDAMGHNQGSAGPFCSSTACDAWRQTFFFGATCTAQPVYPIYDAPPPGTCSNYPN